MNGILTAFVDAELAEPVDPRVSAVATAIAAAYSGAARAVLFYGSCLRTADLDGQMLDFYLIVSGYRAAYERRWLASANRLVPPNVFPFEHDGLAAKYAVLSEADFHRLNGPETDNVSVWARFAQPARMVWSADGAARQAVVAAIARAAPALLRAAWPVLDEAPSDPLDFWRAAFALTYSAELRAEKRARAASVVDFDPERYRRFTAATMEAAGIGTMVGGKIRLAPVSDAARQDGMRAWARRRRNGKLLSVLRLAKASGTFAGGIDYLAWKVNRHAGTNIRIKPWQRKLPLLAALILLPRLLKGKAIR